MVTEMDISDKLKIYCIMHPLMKMLFSCISYIVRFTIKNNSYFDLSLAERWHLKFWEYLGAFEKLHSFKLQNIVHILTSN